MKTKTEKSLHVVNSVAPSQRAKGTKVIGKNPTLVAKADVNVEKLPNNLRPVFEKIAKAGRNGEHIRTLYPRTSPSNRYCWWHCRTLIKMGYVKQIPEPVVAKDLMADAKKKAIAKKSVAKKSNLQKVA